jgi:ketosteroid isomerase-like protein
MTVTALEQRTGSAAFDHQNAELVQTLYRALRARDLEAAAELIYPDFVAHVPGKGINAGEYWSVEGFKTLFSNVLAYNGGHFDVRVPVVSVNGADVFTREVLELNRTADPERIWTLPVSMHYKIKAGKMSEMWVLPEDQRLYDDYWSGPSATGGATSRAPASAEQLARSRPTEINVEGASSARNLDLLTELYDRFFRGDGDVMRDMISEDVIVDIVGRSAMSGEYHGWDGFVQFRQKLMSMVDQRYKLEIDSIAASERDGWVKEYIRMDRPWDSTFSTIYVVMHFEFADGKITRIDDFPVDTYAWEEFYTPPSTRTVG